MALEITVKIPDELAHDADEFNLLEESTILELLQSELERRVNEMINEEVHAYRAEENT